MDKEMYKYEMGNALLWVYFRRSMPATHLAHGEGEIDLIGVGAQLSPRVRISRLKACHDAWRGTELAGGRSRLVWRGFQ